MDSERKKERTLKEITITISNEDYYDIAFASLYDVYILTIQMTDANGERLEEFFQFKQHADMKYFKEYDEFMFVVKSALELYIKNPITEEFIKEFKQIKMT